MWPWLCMLPEQLARQALRSLIYYVKPHTITKKQWLLGLPRPRPAAQVQPQPGLLTFSTSWAKL